MARTEVARMTEGFWAGLFFVLLILGMLGFPFVWYVLIWRPPHRESTGQGTVGDVVLNTAVLSQLTRRIGDLEKQVEEAQREATAMQRREQAECDKRMETLMIQIARLTLRLEEMSATRRDKGDSPNSQLYALIVEHLGLDEVERMMFELGLDSESIGGDTLNMRSLNLLVHLQKRNRTGELVTLLRRRRPDVAWPDILDKERLVI
jgi:hypothetical protein